MPTQEQIDAWRRREFPDGADMDDWLLAVVYVVTDEINLLRAQHGLAARTKDQVATAIRNKVADLTVD